MKFIETGAGNTGNISTHPQAVSLLSFTTSSLEGVDRQKESRRRIRTGQKDK